MFVFKKGFWWGGAGQEPISVAIRIWEQLKPFSVYIDVNIKRDCLCVTNAVREGCTGWTSCVKIQARAGMFPYTVEFQNDPGALSVLNSMLTPLLSPWSRVLLEKLTGSQLVTNLPVFYGTRRFITVLTSAVQLSLS
jgi:hypothetical protein